MKTQVITTTVPVLVLGGIILFLGCGAESQKAETHEHGTGDSKTLVVNTPMPANATTAPTEPVPKIVAAPPVLSPGVSEIAQLAQAGVGDEVLQAYIENSPTPYQLQVEEILYLHDLGLSAETIAAMVRHNQSLQDQPATAIAANTRTATNSVLPATVQPETQPATIEPAQNANTPSFPENPQAPDNAYSITPPPQQVNYNYFYQTLAPYGTWVEVADHGWCWQPTVAIVDVGWRPYCNRGRWLWTDNGWYWQSDYSWGWAPFHYGRWYRSPAHGWVWAPDTIWGPAWVTWRYSDSYCGWAPLPPGAYIDAGVGFRFGGNSVTVGFDFGLVPDCYNFIPTAYFCDRTPWYYCLPRTRVVNVFNHTTIINNYIIGSNNRTIVHVGPGTDAIARVARHEIRKVTVRDMNPASSTLIKADRLDRDGKTLEVFRPRLPQQAPAPPPEITRRQQKLLKNSESIAKSEAVNLARQGTERKAFIAPPRASGETLSSSRGTPLVTPRATGSRPDSHVSGAENSPRIVTGQSPQAVAPTASSSPVISRNPRSERRNSDASQSSSAIPKPYQAERTPRPLAEVSPGTFQSQVPAREERPNVYQPPQNPQPDFRPQERFRQPTFPGDRPQPNYHPQVITPPVYRQEDRKPELPSASRFSSPPAYNPSTPAPRAADPGFNPPAYRPPQTFSPPAAAPRPIEVPAARPSSPAPSYSPPAVSRPQPAPSAQPSPGRSDNGRKP